MAESQDDSEKTEEPSHRRLEQAHAKGQVPFSRELVSFAVFLGFVPVLFWIWPAFTRGYLQKLSAFLESDGLGDADEGTMLALAWESAYAFFSMFLVPAIVLFFAIVLIAAVQHAPVWTAEQLMPKWERISPLAGLKRLFSMRSVVEFLKGVLKLISVAAVAVVAVYPDAPRMLNLFALPLGGAMDVIGDAALRFLIGVCILTAGVGTLDYLYQRFDYMKSLRMSMQEIKDEYKETEGNPEIKAKLRQLRMERSRTRMMAAVPTADVVVTNPTHYAVALKYDMDNDDAPRLVAKGADFLALAIRDKAKEHGVPIIQNPPLARALYQSVEIDSVIPAEYYRAVAEIIRYVYKLKGKL
jgi:flagellar biosynthetic protein FlhB